jgi:hypothetical protein
MKKTTQEKSDEKKTLTDLEKLLEQKQNEIDALKHLMDVLEKNDIKNNNLNTIK